jgi:hypothetical protein
MNAAGRTSMHDVRVGLDHRKGNLSRTERIRDGSARQSEAGDDAEWR